MPQKNRIILDLCGGTGAWSQPYKDAGYKVINLTYPAYDVTRTGYGTDHHLYFRRCNGVNDLVVRVEDVYGILAAPPCTMFSLARTTAKTPRDFAKAMEVVEACLQTIWHCRKYGKLKFWALENPMGYLRQFLGRPAFTFDPSEFGGDYNKTTDLWGYFKDPSISSSYKRFESTDKNTRKMPLIPADYERDPEMRPRAIARSITNGGFAKAFFKANQ